MPSFLVNVQDDIELLPLISPFLSTYTQSNCTTTPPPRHIPFPYPNTHLIPSDTTTYRHNNPSNPPRSLSPSLHNHTLHLRPSRHRLFWGFSRVVRAGHRVLDDALVKGWLIAGIGKVLRDWPIVRLIAQCSCVPCHSQSKHLHSKVLPNDEGSCNQG